MTPPHADEARDYRWRLSMKQTDWAHALAALAAEIDYANFKKAVHERPDQQQEQRVSVDLERDAAGADGRGRRWAAEGGATF